ADPYSCVELGSAYRIGRLVQHGVSSDNDTGGNLRACFGEGGRVAGTHGVGEPPPPRPSWYFGVLAAANSVFDHFGGGEQAVAADGVNGALCRRSGGAGLGGL